MRSIIIVITAFGVMIGRSNNVEKDQEVVHQSVTNSLCNAIGCLSESRLTVNVAV